VSNFSSGIALKFIQYSFIFEKRKQDPGKTESSPLKENKMNNNFTHKELKNFTLRFSNFFTILKTLPASPWFAVNFLFVQYNNLLSQPAISKLFNGNKPELKFIPVVISNPSNFKK
jgi:hypothetical protein